MKQDAISRRDGQRTNTIKAYIDSDTLPDEVNKALLKLLDEVGFELPPGYRMEVGGDTEESREGIAGLFGYVPILVLLIAATLVLALRSFWLAGLLGLVALLSVGLSTLSVWSFGFPFTFMAIVGTFGLIGVGINDSIVVVAALRANRAASEGHEPAIVNEVLGTGRYLVSTTLTTIGGFVPLFLAGGFWPPLAAAIAGGVGGTTIMAFFFVPAAYAFLVRRPPKSSRRLKPSRRRLRLEDELSRKASWHTPPSMLAFTEEGNQALRPVEHPLAVASPLVENVPKLAVQAPAPNRR